MIEVKSFAERRYDAGKLQKINLFGTERFFCDVYCLEPGQAQKPHAHAGSDKVYAVLEGTVVAQIGAEAREVSAGEAVMAPAGLEHGLVNRSDARAAVLVFMAPAPASAK